MKNKVTVGLYGKPHGLHRKLINDLTVLGFTPFEIDPGDLAHPSATAAVICTSLDLGPSESQNEKKKLSGLSLLIESLREEQIHMIFVSLAARNHPETPIASFGHLELRAEAQLREGGIPYTIVRAMSADDRPGHHHKLYWKQDTEGQEKGAEHPVPWEDLAQVLVHCVNRPQVLSKTFTVHAVVGAPPNESPIQMKSNWDHWFQGLNPDSSDKITGRKTA